MKHALAHFEGFALHLRKLRILYRIHPCDGHPERGTADRRLQPVVDGDDTIAAGQLADDITEELSGHDRSSFFLNDSRDDGFDTEREIRTGKADAFVAAFKENAFQNRFGRADGDGVADDRQC